LIATTADYAWSKGAETAAWLERARLNPTRGLRQRGHEPRVQQASKRFTDNVRPALEKLKRLPAA
jgi:hypothetical protein